MVPLGTTTMVGENLTESGGPPYRPFGKSMCFLPNSRASMDQAPGPTIAKTAPRTRLDDSDPWIARMREIPRESDPHLNDGCQRSCHWSPQTDQKKYPRNHSDDLQDDDGHRRRCKNAGDPKVDEQTARKQPQEQKTQAGPTTRERRK
jgi:hypothetical protein